MLNPILKEYYSRICHKPQLFLIGPYLQDLAIFSIQQHTVLKNEKNSATQKSMLLKFFFLYHFRAQKHYGFESSGGIKKCLNKMALCIFLFWGNSPNCTFVTDFIELCHPHHSPLEKVSILTMRGAAGSSVWCSTFSLLLLL